MSKRISLKFMCFVLALVMGKLLITQTHNVSADASEISSFQERTTTPLPPAPSPADVIDAVNNLRLTRGLNALTIHPVLMQVAADQASALAATGGAIGHQRPCGMTLGQELLMLGFPLWGDLSMDGYRSENWVTASTADEAISFWLGDDLHTNTMLSPNRSDIGAAVAISDQIYIVLETALKTSSGQMQSTAYDILTSIPMTQSACMGLATQYAEAGDYSQYSIPVVISTALPDGDVIHEVAYGQSLWSIAIQYHTTIAELKRLNNLSDDTIAPGWKLLIQKGATQPVPITDNPAVVEITSTSYPTSIPFMTKTSTMTATFPAVPLGQQLKQNSMVVAALLISFSILLAGFIGFGRKKEE